jgi:DNA-directed RNA polymerase specialized sigma24 family protein
VSMCWSVPSDDAHRARTQAGRADEVDQLEHLLAQLEPLQREALELRVRDGLSREVTAVILGCSATDVAMLQHAALDGLRRGLSAS